MASGLGHRDQRAVAGVVALAVVEQLEVVQVEEQQRDRPRRAAGQQGAGAFAPGAAVEHVGQRVVVGQHAHLVAVVAQPQRAVGQAQRQHDGLECAGGQAGIVEPGQLRAARR